MARHRSAPDEPSYFLGHYVEWRRVRLHAIVEHYGLEWFPGKRILELGCAQGHLGISLAMLGAEVTFSDGRQEHLDEIQALWPLIPEERIICANLEREWPFEGHWDMVLHQGLLYHLEHWGFGLQRASECCDHMVLETETLDSNDPTARKIVEENKEAMHSAVDGTTIKVPAAGIEAKLTAIGFEYEMHLDEAMNTGYHRYVWKVRNTGQSCANTRRFWWCWRDDHGST